MTKWVTGGDHTVRGFMIVLLTKYCPGYQIMYIKIGGACMGESRRAYRILMEKLEEKTRHH